MRHRAHLHTEDLTKGFESHPVLSGITLTVGAGQRLGVVGENGRGKSTLLHLLSGDLAPDAGSVTRHGSVSLAAQEFPFAPADTIGSMLDHALASVRTALAELDDAATALAEDEPGADQRYANALANTERLAAWDAERRTDLTMEALGAPTDRNRRLGRLSVSQRYRARLACLLAEQADILLLDEPTNHLSITLVDELTEALRSTHAAAVVATHDRRLLHDLADWRWMELAN